MENIDLNFGSEYQKPVHKDNVYPTQEEKKSILEKRNKRKGFVTFVTVWYYENLLDSCRCQEIPELLFFSSFHRFYRNLPVCVVAR